MSSLAIAVAFPPNCPGFEETFGRWKTKGYHRNQSMVRLGFGTKCTFGRIDSDNLLQGNPQHIYNIFQRAHHVGKSHVAVKAPCNSLFSMLILHRSQTKPWEPRERNTESQFPGFRFLRGWDPPFIFCLQRSPGANQLAAGQTWVPKIQPGKWTHGLKSAVPCLILSHQLA